MIEDIPRRFEGEYHLEGTTVYATNARPKAHELEEEGRPICTGFGTTQR
jgi:hypothetical protein